MVKLGQLLEMGQGRKLNPGSVVGVQQLKLSPTKDVKGISLLIEQGFNLARTHWHNPSVA
jgi:hypothetical protein